MAVTSTAKYCQHPAPSQIETWQLPVCPGDSKSPPPRDVLHIVVHVCSRSGFCSSEATWLLLVDGALQSGSVQEAFFRGRTSGSRFDHRNFTETILGYCQGTETLLPTLKPYYRHTYALYLHATVEPSIVSRPSVLGLGVTLTAAGNRMHSEYVAPQALSSDTYGSVCEGSRVKLEGSANLTMSQIPALPVRMASALPWPSDLASPPWESASPPWGLACQPWGWTCQPWGWACQP